MSEKSSTLLVQNNVQRPADPPFASVSREALASWNANLREKSPLEIVRWAVACAGGRAIVSTNFRPYEAAILHLATQVQPDIPVLWVDHGYNRPATYQHAETLRARLKLNLKRDAGFSQGLGFFAAATKNKRVAAFEAHDIFPFARETDERAFNVALRAAEAATLLADENALRIRPDQREDFRRDEVVVDHGIGLLNETMRFQREKLRVAGTRSDEINVSDHVMIFVHVLVST